MPPIIGPPNPMADPPRPGGRLQGSSIDMTSMPMLPPLPLGQPAATAAAADNKEISIHVVARPHRSEVAMMRPLSSVLFSYLIELAILNIMIFPYMLFIYHT